ncbi:MAG TPA: right-handed parallel beta-helix repeat-containing protein, partial [Gemmataceae bacterium]
TIADNTAVPSGSVGGRGGGIDVYGGGLLIEDGTVSGNAAGGGGGGISFFGLATNALTVRRTTVSGNSAGGGVDVVGGGLQVFGTGPTGALLIEDSTVAGNTAAFRNSGGGGGGGIAFGTYAGTDSLTIRRTVVEGNTAVVTFNSGGGGGIRVLAGGIVAVEDSTIRGNTAAGTSSGGGGAAYVSADGRLTLLRSTVAGNATVGRGGGVYVAAVTPSAMSGGSLSVDGCTIAGNSAGTSGGGAYLAGNLGGSTAVLRNTTVYGNTGPAGGGVELWGVSDTLLVQNSTVTGNTATLTSGAGGIQVSGSYSPSGTGGSATVLLQSSVVAGNTTGTVTGGPDVLADAAGPVTFTADHSLIGVADKVTLSPMSANNRTGTAAAPLDARLGPLQDNGGPTQTCAPLPGSPILDHGANPAGLAADQGGSPRVIGVAADIGAVEAASPGVPVAGGGPYAAVTTAGDTGYTFAVTYSDDTAVAAAPLGDGDVRVTGPNGFDAPATFVGVDTPTDGSPRTATYFVAAPGGAWADAADGTYSITVQPNQVFDTTGNPVAAGEVGMFRVLIPKVFTVTTLNSSGPGSLADALTQANAAPAADVIQFAPALFAAGPATIPTIPRLPAVTDSVTITGPGSRLLTLRGLGLTIGTPGTVLTVSVSGLTVTGGSDGGITIGDEDVTLTDVAVMNNSSYPDASTGGIQVWGGGRLTVRNSTIANNTSNGVGGGISFPNGGTLTIENSTIAGNRSTGGGGSGGIGFFGRGGISIHDSTISGNTGAGGGGIALTSFVGGAFIQDTTITRNAATATTGAQGGGIAASTSGLRAGQVSSVTLLNTIVAGNTSASGRPDISAGTGSGQPTVFAQYCLFGVADAVTLSAGSASNLTGTAAAPLDPKLGPLADNGGSTFTHALLAGSPALNQGANYYNPVPGTDQRGLARQVGPAADIGAYEYTPITPTVQVNNDGAPQRSVVRSITVTFSGPVAFAGGNAAAAFTLTRTGPSGPTGTVGLTPTVTTDAQGRTVVTLTFSGPFTEANTAAGVNPSLIDGVYTLTISAAAVTDAALGWALDGDGNGTPGGDRVFATHRLFGDADGDGDVDLLDLNSLVPALFGTVGQPAYNPAFDFDGDGDVDLLDLNQFVSRMFLSGYTP